VFNPVYASSNVAQTVTRRRLKSDVWFKFQGSPQRVYCVQRGAEQVFSDTFVYSLAVIISPTFHIHVLSRLFCFVGIVLDTHYSETRDPIDINPTSISGDFWSIYQHRLWPTDLRFSVVFVVTAVKCRYRRFFMSDHDSFLQFRPVYYSLINLSFNAK
jgi:hypothetical protein